VTVLYGPKFAGDHEPEAPLAILLTTSSSSRFLRWLSGPGRLVFTATREDEEDSETDPGRGSSTITSVPVMSAGSRSGVN